MNNWKIDSKLFPVKGSLEEKITFLLRYAVLSPSGHNSQPWNFRICQNKLEVLPDYSRIRTMVDPDKRELFISMGAVAKNLELAGNYYGLVGRKKIDGDKIIYKFEEAEGGDGGEGLFKAITKRRTYRDDFKAGEIELSRVSVLGAMSRTDSRLVLVDDKHKGELATLVHDSELIWYKSRDIMDELAEWMRDDISESEDGLPSSVISMYKIVAEMKYIFSKNGEVAVKQANLHKKWVLEAPLLAAITSEKDNIESWIESGELYETVGLSLTKMGLSNGLLNSIVELNGQRRKLERTLGVKGKVQMLLRIGHPKYSAKPTPRRSIKEMLIK